MSTWSHLHNRCAASTVLCGTSSYMSTPYIIFLGQNLTHYPQGPLSNEVRVAGPTWLDLSLIVSIITARTKSWQLNCFMATEQWLIHITTLSQVYKLCITLCKVCSTYDIVEFLVLAWNTWCAQLDEEVLVLLVFFTINNIKSDDFPNINRID